MKMNKNVMTFIACLVILVLITSCDKNEEEKNNGVITFQVLTQDPSPSLMDVYLYKTNEDRTNDLLRQNYLKTARTYTCTMYLGDSAAMFTNLRLEKYYIYAKWGAYGSVETEVVAKEDTARSVIFVGCTFPGNLEVLAEEPTEFFYMGGAEVFLYKSQADRDNDTLRTGYYRKALTDISQPQVNGAIFYELLYQKYYFFVKWTHPSSGRVYVGAGAAFVPSCITTRFTVQMQ
jgi:hypothetical protein